MSTTRDCALCSAVNKQDQRVLGYRLIVCDLCWQNAANGWPKDAEPVLFAALANAGLLIPDRTDHGLLPRQYAPPADYAL